MEFFSPAFMIEQKNTNHLHTWEFTIVSHHSFSRRSCVTKTKYLNNSALLLKFEINLLSKITSFCKENRVLLYNYYYKSSPTLLSLVETEYNPNGCENQSLVNILITNIL